mmetsp:Transcript_3363/g.12205  ORF Transcript_3363/g.12205 Transcript_3363/m.12205 type:complete len:203 (+) Transcript_3363:451-1059(+)
MAGLVHLHIDIHGAAVVGRALSREAEGEDGRRQVDGGDADPLYARHPVAGCVGRDNVHDVANCTRQPGDGRRRFHVGQGHANGPTGRYSSPFRIRAGDDVCGRGRGRVRRENDPPELAGLVESDAQHGGHLENVRGRRSVERERRRRDVSSCRQHERHCELLVGRVLIVLAGNVHVDIRLTRQRADDEGRSRQRSRDDDVRA